MDEALQRRYGWVPNALSAARVAFVGLTYVAAWRQDAPAFATLVLLTTLTDILDGPIARHLGIATRFGANVDSAADLLFYLSLPAWVYLFRPEVVVQQRYLIAVFAVLYLSVNILSHVRFGALGVHNRLSRASGTVGVVGAFYLILWGLDVYVFVAIIATLAADLSQRFGALVRHEMSRRPQRRSS